MDGAGGDDVVLAASGDDVVTGGDGDDLIIGATGDDSIDAGTGYDTVEGGDGYDTLGGGDDDDSLDGGDLDDSLDGGLGNDSLFGSDGFDTLVGSAGDDCIEGGAGDDSIDAGDGLDSVVGGEGSDTIGGQAGDDSLYGGLGNGAPLLVRLADDVGLVDAIDRRLQLLRVHFPYHESDHVLNFAINAWCDGDCMQDMELRRNDAGFLDALGADATPDPTTAGDFCRRFQADDVRSLLDAIDDARITVWRRQPSGGEFFREATIDVDGTLVITTGGNKTTTRRPRRSCWIGYAAPNPRASAC